MDYSLPGSSVHGILWATILEWVAIPFTRGSSQPGIKPTSLTSPALAGGLCTGKPLYCPRATSNPPMGSVAINTLMTQKCLSQPCCKREDKKNLPPQAVENIGDNI